MIGLPSQPEIKRETEQHAIEILLDEINLDEINN
jgi:hypothetical protein